MVLVFHFRLIHFCEQENTLMLARGNVGIVHKDELLEAEMITCNHLTRTAKAKGTVKLKTADVEYLAEEIILDENFHYSLAIPLLGLFPMKASFL